MQTDATGEFDGRRGQTGAVRLRDRVGCGHGGCHRAVGGCGGPGRGKGRGEARGADCAGTVTAVTPESRIVVVESRLGGKSWILGVEVPEGVTIVTAKGGKKLEE